MNTFIKNILLFMGEIKRSMSEGGKQWGKEDILGKYVPAKRFAQAFLKLDTWFESRRGDGEKGEVKKVKVNLVGVMK